MSAKASLATIAEYFRLGLQIGLLEPTQAVAWADSQIKAADSVPEGLIGISWSKGLASTMDALSAIPGERDIQLAGHWLLGLIGQSIPESVDEIQQAVQRAMHVALHAELGEETYYRLDMFDDELSLARTNVYGTVDQCRINFADELAKYSALDLDAAVQPVQPFSAEDVSRHMFRIANASCLFELEVLREEHVSENGYASLLLRSAASSNNYQGQSEMWVFTESMQKFCASLIALNETLLGEALLDSLSPNELSLKLAPVNSRGYLGISGLIGNHLSSENSNHWHSVSFGFEFESAQLQIAAQAPWVKKYAG